MNKILEGNAVEEDVEDVEDSEDLLYSTYYGIRVFHFSGSWDNVMVGVLLEETDDSFLVSIPASMSREDSIIKYVGLTHVPYMRMMKTEFRAVTKPTEEIESSYIEYLGTASLSIFPDILSLLGVDRTVSNRYTDKVPVTPTKGGLVTTNGLTEKEVSERVDKAMKEGFFVHLDETKQKN